MALTINTYNPKTQEMVQAYVEMIMYTEERYYSQYQRSVDMAFFVDKAHSIGANADWFKVVQVVNLPFDPAVARTDEQLYQQVLDGEGYSFGFDWSTAEFYVEPV